MASSVTHKPKAGALLTGTEYEAADSHTVSITAADVGAEASGAVATHAAAGDPHTGYRLESADHSHATTGLQAGQLLQANTHQTPDTDATAGSLHHTIGTSATQAAAGNHSHTGNAPDSVDFLVGTASAGLSAEIVVGTTPGGELGGTWASPTVDATHSGSAHVALTANTPAAVTTSGAVGTGTASAKDDHAHAHEAAHTAHDTVWAAKGDLLAGTANDTAAVVTVGADDTILMADAAAAAGVKWVASATPSTQAMGDAAAVGTGDTFTRGDHKHAMPALGTTAAAIGTSAGGSAVTPSKSDHVHATGAGAPSTQAMGDAAATGTGPAASMTDHKHAMPTLGFGLTSNSTPAVSLTNSSAFATATTSISAATYADVTGASVSLAAGTWLVIGQCVGSSVNAQAIMHVAITDGANTVVSEGSQGIGASGTASVAQLGNIIIHAIVAPGSLTTYKLRAARGLTTITGTWVAMDGAGTNVTNNLTDNSDKGSAIFAVRIA